MTSVVYTAIFGRRDRLWNPATWQADVRYVCLTDQPNLAEQSKADPKWEIHVVRPLFPGDPRMSAKWWKVMAHELPFVDRSLWLDGSLQLIDLRRGWGRMTTDLALNPHPNRRCIYAEGRRLLGRRIDRENVRRVIDEYREQGHPEDWGLWRGGVIWRQHTREVAEFNSLWWRLIRSGSYRDQLSLPVVLRTLGIAFDEFPRSIPQLCWRGHPLREEMCPTS